MSPDQEHIAVVFGASGIISWGVRNALLTSPTFTHIIGLTNRPLTQSQPYCPILPTYPSTPGSTSPSPSPA